MTGSDRRVFGPSRPSLVDYLYTELRRGYDLGNDEQRYRDRREKFYIFLKIPVQLEKVCLLLLSSVNQK